MSLEKAVETTDYTDGTDEKGDALKVLLPRKVMNFASAPPVHVLVSV
jgi:hypothetical protein